MVFWFSSSKIQSVDAVSFRTIFGEVVKKVLYMSTGYLWKCKNVPKPLKYVHIYSIHIKMQLHTVVCIYECSTSIGARRMFFSMPLIFHPIIQSSLQLTLSTATQERYPTRRPHSDRSTITDDSMWGNAALATCNKIGKACVSSTYPDASCLSYHHIICARLSEKKVWRGRIKFWWIPVPIALNVKVNPYKWINAAYKHIQDTFQILAVTYHGCNWSPSMRLWIS